ncbi:hypothetical protein [Stenotrophomonas humi]|uniref:hypothetical protein n=1 Tax=Stenotrophomonas humi TaxID=405444 RepID=UPI000A9BAEF1|nr:hypothetical protein [Stenotrophomonas humi]
MSSKSQGTIIAAGFAFAVLAVAANVHAGERMTVTVIDRQDSAQDYAYSVPGISNSYTTGSAQCSGYGSSANCSGTANTSTVSAPGFVGTYQVRGATLSLQLPDGRIAVANCAAKMNWSEWSNPSMYRSCRIPMSSTVSAEFSGDKVKLEWPVSIDGKKLQKESYKILAILDAQ